MNNKISLVSTLIFIVVLFQACSKDEEAPTINILSPANNSYFGVDNTFTIKVSAHDNDAMSQVKLYIDGVIHESINTEPYDFLIEENTLSIGSHTLQAKGYDQSSNMAESEIVVIELINPPAADFSADITDAGQGELITFTNLSTGNPTSYNWDFGDGSSSTEQNPLHSYTEEGLYSVSLTVSNQIDSDTETKTDYINVFISVTDYDGNIYKAVTIGDQVWMAENLKVTHYPDGTEITHITDNAAWANLEDNNTDEAYCYHSNNANSEADIYGALYTWAAAKEACPTGWHLPSDQEWTTMENYLSNNNYTGIVSYALKANSGWLNNGGGDGYSGFDALPGANRKYYNGEFLIYGTLGYWWTNTEYEHDASSSYGRSMSYQNNTVNRGNFYKSYGLSVRCIRD